MTGNQNFKKGYNNIDWGKKSKNSSGRYYIFTLENGTKKTLTMQAAMALNDPCVTKRVGEIKLSMKSKRRVRDGFQAGWHENIRQHVGGPQEYAKILRSKGLVEVGKDFIPGQDFKEVHPCANADFAKAVAEEDSELSGTAIDAIEDGTMFDEDFND